jgi:hypothetical protein
LFLRVLDGGGIPGATGFPGGEWRTFWDGRDALNKPPRAFRWGGFAPSPPARMARIAHPTTSPRSRAPRVPPPAAVWISHEIHETCHFYAAFAEPVLYFVHIHFSWEASAMASITFDTHKFVRKLESAGFTTDQAEAVADAFRDASGEADLATKRDIDDLRRDMREMEQRMIIKLGGLIVLAVTVVATLDKLL